MPAPERRHSKFNLEFREEELQRFEPDSEEGPVVGFVREGQNVRLITLEHRIVIEPSHTVDGQLVAIRGDKPTQLRYTPEEWVAFYLGVREGDFDAFYERQQMLLRDSKDPNGPVFMIPGENWRPFMDAVKGGKYDVPSRQEARILPKLELAPPKPRT